jgi:hypothetical protein
MTTPHDDKAKDVHRLARLLWQNLSDIERAELFAIVCRWDGHVRELVREIEVLDEINDEARRAYYNSQPDNPDNAWGDPWEE